MVRVVNSLGIVVFLCAILLQPAVAVAETTIPPSLVFTEIKARYDSANLQDPDEFIEIFNASLVPVALTGYVIEYFNTTNPPETQLPTQKAFSDKVLAPAGQLVLAKQPAKITNSIASPFSSLADTGGRLRLVTTEGDIIDEIAWTNSQAVATASGVYPSIVYQCNASNTLCNANRSQSFSRQVTPEGLYVINGATWQLGVISPVSNELQPVIDDADEELEQQQQSAEQQAPAQQQAPDPTCKGIVITELLPNAKGSDTGKEFIELHNPNAEPISLLGCSLKISSSSKIYHFEDIVLAPGAYVSFSDKITGLTMPNVAGGTVWLLTPQEELQAITYPGNIEEDVSWASFNDVWEATYTPTPGFVNMAQPNKPCRENEQRNVVTGDCEKIIKTAVASLTACKAGQERNPETNRCRSIITAAALVACKAGQERNPETNRCRAVKAASTLQPCDEGQERNPETNRCRKVTNATTTGLAKVTDVQSPGVTSGSKIWLLTAAGILVVGYGIYEWRQDIGAFIGKHVSRLRR